MLEAESMLNTEVLSTAAESPFQNGVCERNHQVVDSILTKLVQDFPSTPVDILLKWSCMAKNSLQLHCGFSSHQLVSGRNPKLPNVISSSPSSLEASTTSNLPNTSIVCMLHGRGSSRVNHVKRSKGPWNPISQPVSRFSTQGTRFITKETIKRDGLDLPRSFFRTEKLFSWGMGQYGSRYIQTAWSSPARSSSQYQARSIRLMCTLMTLDLRMAVTLISHMMMITMAMRVIILETHLGTNSVMEIISLQMLQPHPLTA